MTPANKLLVIASDAEIRDNLASALCDAGAVSVSDGKNVRGIISDGNFSLIILNTPLADEFGLELASFIRKNSGSALIILSSKKNCAEINKKAGKLGALVLPRPIGAQALAQTAAYILSERSRVMSLESEKSRLEEKIHDIKQIDRAKCVLIQYLRISEEDAHRMIQKRAMDERVPEAQIALDILKTYEY